MVRLGGAVEASVVDLMLGVDDAPAVRAGEDPEAPVFRRGVIECDPRRRERPVAGRDEVLVLVPCLAGLALGLYKQHRLHRLHVRADDRGQDLDDPWVEQEVVHRLRQLVGEMDAQHGAQNVLVGHPGAGLGQPVHLAPLAAGQPQCFAPKRLHLVQGEQFGVREEAVALVGAEVHHPDVQVSRRHGVKGQNFTSQS